MPCIEHLTKLTLFMLQVASRAGEIIPCCIGAEKHQRGVRFCILFPVMFDSDCKGFLMGFLYAAGPGFQRKFLQPDGATSSQHFFL